MTSKPLAQDLLDVVREFMERDLLPALSAERVPSSEFSPEGPVSVSLWFQCKVAINVLGIVRRELELGQHLRAAEQQRLIDLLGQAGLPDHGRHLHQPESESKTRALTGAESQREAGSSRDVEVLAEPDYLDALNRRLCAAIRNGEIGEDSADLIRHLRATLTEALRINNPKWLDNAD
jgi:hypothetical protein